MGLRKTRNTDKYTVRTALACVIVIAAGPTLDQSDVAIALGSGLPVIVVGDAWRFTGVRGVDIYHCDHDWWAANIAQIRDRQKQTGKIGRLLCIDPATCDAFGLEHVPCVDFHASQPGLSGVPGAITQGGSSGYQALHIAFNTGAQRIVLLGYDYGATGRTRLDGSPCTSDFPHMIRNLEILAQSIGKTSTKVINSTRITALACFPRMTLADALKGITDEHD